MNLQSKYLNMKSLLPILLLIALVSAQEDLVQLEGYSVGDCYLAADWPSNSGTSTNTQSTNNQTEFSFFVQVTLAGWTNVLPYFCYHEHLYSFMYANVTTLTASSDSASDLLVYSYSMQGLSVFDCYFDINNYLQE